VDIKEKTIQELQACIKTQKITLIDLQNEYSNYQIVRMNLSFNKFQLHSNQLHPLKICI